MLRTSLGSKQTGKKPGINLERGSIVISLIWLHSKSVRLLHDDEDSLLVSTKEHLLLGIRGTVRRKQDSHIIHANFDTDVILSEEPEDGCEIYWRLMFYS